MRTRDLPGSDSSRTVFQHNIESSNIGSGLFDNSLELASIGRLQLNGV